MALGGASMMGSIIGHMMNRKQDDGGASGGSTAPASMMPTLQQYAAKQTPYPNAPAGGVFPAETGGSADNPAPLVPIPPTDAAAPKTPQSAAGRLASQFSGRSNAYADNAAGMHVGSVGGAMSDIMARKKAAVGPSTDTSGYEDTGMQGG